MMRLSTPALFGALVLTACGGNDDEAGGYDFVSPDGDYSVTFPAQPSRRDLPIDIGGNTVTADAYVFERSDGGAAYVTTTFDYATTIDTADVATVLDNARDGAVTGVAGTLVSHESVERDGVPGVSFTYSVVNGADAGRGAGLILFDDPVLYVSFALGPEADADAYDAFVDTFEFTREADS